MLESHKNISSKFDQHNNKTLGLLRRKVPHKRLKNRQIELECY